MTKTFRPFLSVPEAAYATPKEASPSTQSADVTISSARLLKRDFMTFGSFRGRCGVGGDRAMPDGTERPPARHLACAFAHAGVSRLDEDTIPWRYATART